MLKSLAAVFRKAGEPLSLETVSVRGPGPREVLVRVAASGVCASDLHLIDGASTYSLGLPVVMGHEGAGVVEAVGAGVARVSRGSHVVIVGPGGCGDCRRCLSGAPNLCAALAEEARRRPARVSVMVDGISGSGAWPFLEAGTHSEYALVDERAVVEVEPHVPLDLAALLACGVLTGLGAVFRTARVAPGQSVAVFGCGGVGLNVVQGARIAGASPVVAVDVDPEKLDLAHRLGATDLVNASKTDSVAAVRRACRASDGGADHAFEVTGLPGVFRQAVESLAYRGTMTAVGMPPAGAEVSFPFEALRRERRVQTSHVGSHRFREDVPRYLGLWRVRLLQLEPLVTRRRPLAEANEAVADLRAGAVRTVLVP